MTHKLCYNATLNAASEITESVEKKYQKLTEGDKCLNERV